MRAFVGAVVVGTLLSGATAYAQVDEDSRERQMENLERMREMAAAGREGRETPMTAQEAKRHSGQYFREDVGVRYLSVSGLTPYGEMTLSGPAGYFGFHFGGAVQRNALLGVHVYGAAVRDPKLTVSVPGMSLTGTATGTTVSLFGVGPELTCSGLAGQLSFSANRDKGEFAPTWRTWGAGVALSATYN